MGCSSCGTSTGGKALGCKSNGGCSSGSCNRMNVHDWLVNLPFSDPNGACKIIEVSFNNGSRKDFFRNTTLQTFTKGDMIAVEGVAGFDVGMVTISGELVRLQLKKNGIKEDNPEIKKVLRRASDMDIKKLNESKDREPEALIRSRAIARQLNLDMKLSEVEIQADGRKATFFYIADDRVDFRELIKIYASEFKVKVEMRQIGARQEAAKVGGVGSCGRELCCSTWLSDFKSVTTAAARYQNLSINQTKLSGQCGRLKCCLNYELDTYLDALQFFPENADMLEVAKGTAMLVKKDIFKNLMWYTLPGSTKHYPITIDRVKEIKKLNAQGVRPDELGVVDVVSHKPREVEPEFVDVVGQISLRKLDQKEREKKRQRQQQNRQQRDGGQQQQQKGYQGGQQQKGGQGQGGQQQQRPQQRQQQQNQQQKQGGNQQQQRPPQQRNQGNQQQKGNNFQQRRDQNNQNNPNRRNPPSNAKNEEKKD
jgi:cell fate regulator YaaT (PSP1 superfamily)